jgi:hypothetical protein
MEIAKGDHRGCTHSNNGSLFNDNQMKRRILFVVVYALCFPILMLSVFTIAITGIIALAIYIFNGDKDDTLVDFVQKPIAWAIDLPYKIMGED